MSTEPRRGVCPVCDGTFAITKAGVMRDHNGTERVNNWRQQCAGVGQPPKSLLDLSSEREQAAYWRGYAEAARRLRERADTIAGYGHAYQHAADFLDANDGLEVVDVFN